MGNLSTDAIVTIISTIPGLLVSSLSAWFAYAAIRRRHLAANDIETSTLIVRIIYCSSTSACASSTASAHGCELTGRIWTTTKSTTRPDLA
ncbi:unnamed protein product [Fusarium venenatum]|uniref:Uncharacterized protein n=1 Tax=Fusarium venenatum TaxID=56646 RepID=A0A2L2TEQ6_9HYPO|nr:uncharacterized protein FVRRES_00413 [Fusarium venenatum]CEI63901.1 unnamed protein product [Fusarium venenatum]